MSIASVLKSDALVIKPALFLLDSDHNVVTDLTADLGSGRISYDSTSRFHTSGRCTLSRELQWGAARLKFSVVMASGSEEHSFDMGVFLCGTPSQPIGETPIEYEVDCYDLTALLDMPLGIEWYVDAGTVVTDYVSNLMSADLGISTNIINVIGSTEALSEDMEWGFDTPALTVVNDMLAAIGYFPLYSSRDGKLTSSPITVPADRPVVWDFNADANDTTVAEERVYERDFFNAPNKWIFYISNAERYLPVEGDGIYTVINQSDGPSSVDEVGRTIIKTVALDAIDHDALVAQADLIVAEDKRATEAIQFSATPNPTAWHLDAVTYADSALSVSQKYTVEEWDFDLFGKDTEFVLRRV